VSSRGGIGQMFLMQPAQPYWPEHVLTDVCGVGGSDDVHRDERPVSWQVCRVADAGRPLNVGNPKNFNLVQL